MEQTESSKTKLVCVVDDDANIREIYSAKLHAEGFDVISAENGEDGIALIREKKPDIVLLDILMPVKNGFDVLEEMNEDPSIASIPVVILSNIDDEKSLKTAGKFDTRFYLIKSLTTPQKMVQIVREVLHWRKPPEA